MLDLGRITATLRLDDSDFVKKLQEAKKAIDQFGANGGKPFAQSTADLEAFVDSLSKMQAQLNKVASGAASAFEQLHKRMNTKGIAEGLNEVVASCKNVKIKGTKAIDDFSKSMSYATQQALRLQKAVDGINVNIRSGSGVKGKKSTAGGVKITGSPVNTAQNMANIISSVMPNPESVINNAVTDKLKETITSTEKLGQNLNNVLQDAVPSMEQAITGRGRGRPKRELSEAEQQIKLRKEEQRKIRQLERVLKAESLLKFGNKRAAESALFDLGTSVKTGLSTGFSDKFSDEGKAAAKILTLHDAAYKTSRVVQALNADLSRLGKATNAVNAADRAIAAMTGSKYSTRSVGGKTGLGDIIPSRTRIKGVDSMAELEKLVNKGVISQNKWAQKSDAAFKKYNVSSRQATMNTRALSTQMMGLARSPLFTVLAGGSILAPFIMGIAAAGRLQDALQRLQITMVNTKSTFDVKDVQKWSEAWQNATGMEQKSFIDIANSGIATGIVKSGEDLNRFASSVADLSKAMNVNFTEMAKRVTGAIQRAEMTGFSEIGIGLTSKNKEEYLKSGAQKRLLWFYEQVQRVAKRAATGTTDFNKAFAVLKGASLGTLAELTIEFGSSLVPILNKITQVIVGVKKTLLEWAPAAKATMSKVVNDMKPFVEHLKNMVIVIGTGIIALRGLGFMGSVFKLIGVMAYKSLTGVTLLADGYGKLKQYLRSIANLDMAFVFAKIGASIASLNGYLLIAVAAVVALSLLMDTFTGLSWGTSLLNFLKTFVVLADTIFAVIKGLVTEVAQMVKNTLIFVMDALSTLWNNAISNFSPFGLLDMFKISGADLQVFESALRKSTAALFPNDDTDASLARAIKGEGFFSKQLANAQKYFEGDNAPGVGDEDKYKARWIEDISKATSGAISSIFGGIGGMVTALGEQSAPMAKFLKAMYGDVYDQSLSPESKQFIDALMANINKPLVIEPPTIAGEGRGQALADELAGDYKGKGVGKGVKVATEKLDKRIITFEEWVRTFNEQFAHIYQALEGLADVFAGFASTLRSGVNNIMSGDFLGAAAGVIEGAYKGGTDALLKSIEWMSKYGTDLANKATKNSPAFVSKALGVLADASINLSGALPAVGIALGAFGEVVGMVGDVFKKAYDTVSQKVEQSVLGVGEFFSNSASQSLGPFAKALGVITSITAGVLTTSLGLFAAGIGYIALLAIALGPFLGGIIPALIAMNVAVVALIAVVVAVAEPFLVLITTVGIFSTALVTAAGVITPALASLAIALSAGVVQQSLRAAAESKYVTAIKTMLTAKWQEVGSALGTLFYQFGPGLQVFMEGLRAVAFFFSSLGDNRMGEALWNFMQSIKIIGLTINYVVAGLVNMMSELFLTLAVAFASLGFVNTAVNFINAGANLQTLGLGSEEENRKKIVDALNEKFNPKGWLSGWIEKPDGQEDNTKDNSSSSKNIPDWYNTEQRIRQYGVGGTKPKDLIADGIDDSDSMETVTKLLQDIAMSLHAEQNQKYHNSMGTAVTVNNTMYQSYQSKAAGSATNIYRKNGTTGND